jgi:uncharacterized protein YjbI with pentapeptide repeats
MNQNMKNTKRDAPQHSSAPRIIASGDFRGMNQSHADFQNTLFQEQEKFLFDKAILPHANFTGAKLDTRISFDECDLTGACFKDCVMWFVDMYETCAREAVFENTEMPFVFCPLADFTNASLTDSVFYSATAFDAIFREARLVRTNFCGASFRDADFSGAYISQSDFRRNAMGGSADVCGADFSKAIIEDVHFEDCRYDAKTRFPEGFSPIKHGMKRCGKNRT